MSTLIHDPRTVAASGSRAPAVSPPARSRWLFSRTVDLAAFLGTPLLALALVALGWRLGWLDRDTPEWTWVAGVLLVDVAHVYATAFRVYFDPAELRRRRWLYLLTPCLAFALGWALYSEGEALFWRVLAYLAVFHFIRQQYGWVALYRRQCGETDPLGRRVDAAAIYLATLYPLVWWHAHLPRRFWWFLEQDFAPLPALAADIMAPLFWGVLAIYFGRSLYRGLTQGFWNPGKDIVVATTAACWYIGIVALNSDFAFTVTNVLIHGVPYMVLIYWYRWKRALRPQNTPVVESAGTSGEGEAEGAARSSFPVNRTARTILIFLATVWLLAYAEELLWDRSVWRERSWLFGPAWGSDAWRNLLAPLLAVPQITHYVLDGFLWRRPSRN